jgi:hypothetical protein
LITKSIFLPRLLGNPARQVAAVSGNWVSITTRASLEESQPIEPPRPVKSPTPRRKGLNSVTEGAGAALGAFAAGPSAEYRERGTMAAETSNEERTTKSRRFMRRTKRTASPPQLAAPESFSTTREDQIGRTHRARDFLCNFPGPCRFEPHTHVSTP